MNLGKEMVSAGSGCAIANGVLNGFETTKVKLQLHRKGIYQNPTMMGVMRQVAHEEGVMRGLLMPGLTASLTRSTLYGSYRVGLYPTIRDYVSRVDQSREPTLALRLTSGMLTGALGSMLSCPLDVVRTRMQADAGLIVRGIYTTGLRRGQAVRYTSMLSALYNIWREEGLRLGLYRGASVTILRATLLNGFQLASYDTLKHNVHWLDEGPLLHVSCAFASGIIAQTVVMPIDTIKSHVMVGKGWSTIAKALTEKSPRWFFRGYLPACAGQGFVMVLQMPLIEEFRRLSGVDAI
jgi:hypothetical protein